MNFSLFFVVLLRAVLLVLSCTALQTVLVVVGVLLLFKSLLSPIFGSIGTSRCSLAVTGGGSNVENYTEVDGTILKAQVQQWKEVHHMDCFESRKKLGSAELRVFVLENQAQQMKESLRKGLKNEGYLQDMITKSQDEAERLQNLVTNL